MDSSKLKNESIMKSLLRYLLITLTMASSYASADTMAFSQQTFDKLQQAGRPVLVSIHANWCPTCRAQAPIISSLLKDKDFQDITSLRVDFDDQKDIVRALHASRQSTLILFKGGKEVARSLGDTSSEGINHLMRMAR